MKILSFTIFLVLICNTGYSQKVAYFIKNVDSLKHELAKAKHDTNRVAILNTLCFSYRTANRDLAMDYGLKALMLSRQLKYPIGESDALILLGFAQLDYPAVSLNYSLKGLKVAEKNKIDSRKAWAFERVGMAYRELKNYQQAFIYFNLAQNLFSNIGDSMMAVTVQYQMGTTYLQMNKLDSAYHYAQVVFEKADKLKIPWLQSDRHQLLAETYVKKGKLDEALHLLKQAVKLNPRRMNLYYSIANLYLKLSRTDSSIYYTQKSLAYAQQAKLYPQIIKCATLLSGIYEKRDTQQAIEYDKMIISFQDSLINSNKTNAMKNLLNFDAQERQYEIETAQTDYENKVKLYALLAGLAIFSLIAFILYYNNRQKQRTNKVLQKTLSTLKSTQTQLIQSEKLASLGELTAGIAHEIQNPLNFVNNFSELSIDLIKELKEERNKEKRDETLEEELLEDLSNNQEKINLHGKRASNIVKGMLEHSKASTGKKELTDINALAEEYLRLAYHGMQAKDKNFIIDIQTGFDGNLPKIEVIPQDMGRVLMNLLNNAFYAVKVARTGSPWVRISTRKLADSIEIRVQDNGIGMTEATKGKIFQPFYTTKPTGEGTGLGLSLAYDIITKGHDGTIECESVEGEGTTFIVKLPFILNKS